MWSQIVLVLGVCTQGLLAFGFSGRHPWGSYRPKYDDDELLNCFARFDFDDGTLSNSIGVTITPERDESKYDTDFYDKPYGGLYGGFNKLGAYGGYGGYGDYGGIGGYGGYGGYVKFGDEDTGYKLSARIQLITNANSGKAFVVFTERARVEEGCSIQNFGHILVPNSGIGGGKPYLGLGGYGGYGLYSGLGLGLTGYGLGGYGSGYGTGSFYGGLGYSGGYGYGGLGGFGGSGGYGYGFSEGHGSYGGYDKESMPPDGVIAELTTTQGALATAVVDDIGFNKLEELAGRGVLVCAGITYDWDWKPVCTEPFFSCCDLKYDNVGISLQP